MFSEKKKKEKKKKQNPFITYYSSPLHALRSKNPLIRIRHKEVFARVRLVTALGGRKATAHSIIRRIKSLGGKRSARDDKRPRDKHLIVSRAPFTSFAVCSKQQRARERLDAHAQ